MDEKLLNALLYHTNKKLSTVFKVIKKHEAERKKKEKEKQGLTNGNSVLYYRKAHKEKEEI